MMKRMVLLLFAAAMSLVSLNVLQAGDEYGYIDPASIKEIYEAYDQMEVLSDEYLPKNEWNNPELEKGCLENLTAFYTDENNAPAKIKVLKVYLNFPRWIAHTKVSSDAYDGAPTYRKTFCIFVLQKDADKYMIVWANQVNEDCTNYNRETLKPISYGAPKVTAPNTSEWEDWGKVTAYKLTKEQVINLGLVAGKKSNAAAGKNKADLAVSLEYTPGSPEKAKIQAKNSTDYLILWDRGEYYCLKHDELKKILNSIPSPEQLKVGAKVSAQWTNGSYYNGTLTKISGEAYTIKWDDGSDPLDVTIDQIRLLE